MASKSMKRGHLFLGELRHRVPNVDVAVLELPQLHKVRPQQAVEVAYSVREQVRRLSLRQRHVLLFHEVPPELVDPLVGEPRRRRRRRQRRVQPDVAIGLVAAGPVDRALVAAVTARALRRRRGRGGRGARGAQAAHALHRRGRGRGAPGAGVLGRRGRAAHAPHRLGRVLERRCRSCGRGCGDVCTGRVLPRSEAASRSPWVPSAARGGRRGGAGREGGCEGGCEAGASSLRAASRRGGPKPQQNPNRTTQVHSPQGSPSWRRPA